MDTHTWFAWRCLAAHLALSWRQASTPCLGIWPLEEVVMATQKPARPCTQARVPARQCMHAARSMQMSWCPRWRPCAWRRGGCRSWRASTRPTCCSTRKKKVRVSHHNAGCSKCQGSQDTGKQRQMHTPICMTTHARTHTHTCTMDKHKHKHIHKRIRHGAMHTHV